MKHPISIIYNYDSAGSEKYHVPISICDQWKKQDIDVKVFVPFCPKSLHRSYLEPAMSGLKKLISGPFSSSSQAIARNELNFVRKIPDTGLAYLWNSVPLEILKKLKERGLPIIFEQTRCHLATSKAIQDRAYAKYGLPAGHGITNVKIKEEHEKLLLADFLFCGSKMIQKSMLENEIPKEKLILTSYGWEPVRFPKRKDKPAENPRLKFLFVGYVSVRKGIPMLLKAWAKARLDADLILCGPMEEAVRLEFQPVLARPEVTHVPYAEDIGKLYNKADVFVFPTLEETGPIVTYEAMAHAIMPLVSPTGAGTIVNNGIDGVVLPNYKVDAWVWALKQAFEDHRTRNKMSLAALKQAENFTWEKVASRRAALLKEKFPE
jgi:glycosyltransferase involved in cell wall biosynthesis